MPRVRRLADGVRVPWSARAVAREGLRGRGRGRAGATFGASGRRSGPGCGRCRAPAAGTTGRFRCEVHDREGACARASSAGNTRVRPWPAAGPWGMRLARVSPDRRRPGEAPDALAFKAPSRSRRLRRRFRAAVAHPPSDQADAARTDPARTDAARQARVRPGRLRPAEGRAEAAAGLAGVPGPGSGNSRARAGDALRMARPFAASEGPAGRRRRLLPEFGLDASCRIARQPRQA